MSWRPRAAHGGSGAGAVAGRATAHLARERPPSAKRNRNLMEPAELSRDCVVVVVGGVDVGGGGACREDRRLDVEVVVVVVVVVSAMVVVVLVVVVARLIVGLPWW